MEEFLTSPPPRAGRGEAVPAPGRGGRSLAEDPAWRGQRVTSRLERRADFRGRPGWAAAGGVLLHDGGEYLTDQVLALRTTPGTDGLRLRSGDRSDAVSAAV